AFFCANAARVRCEISARSFSASGANRCSTNGSTSAPSSTTTKGTRCAIRPEMKATSRLRRSSFATTTAAFALHGPAVQGVRALTRLHLHVLADEFQTLGLHEAGHRFPLRFDPQPACQC